MGMNLLDRRSDRDLSLIRVGVWVPSIQSARGGTRVRFFDIGVNHGSWMWRERPFSQVRSPTRDLENFPMTSKSIPYLPLHPCPILLPSSKILWFVRIVSRNYLGRLKFSVINTSSRFFPPNPLDILVLDPSTLLPVVIIPFSSFSSYLERSSFNSK